MARETQTTPTEEEWIATEALYDAVNLIALWPGNTQKEKVDACMNFVISLREIFNAKS